MVNIKQKMKINLALLTALTTLIVCTNSTMCGSDYWYIGFEPSADVTFQVMDYDFDDKKFWIGGSTLNAY